jgi:hypothetical protein
MYLLDYNLLLGQEQSVIWNLHVISSLHNPQCHQRAVQKTLKNIEKVQRTA